MINKNDIKEIRCYKSGMEIILKDGRIGHEIFMDYPRLADADFTQRENYIISYFGIHWPDLDEDLSFDGFFRRSTDFKALF